MIWGKFNKDYYKIKKECTFMEELREQQLEALKEAAGYSSKIITAIGKITVELSGNRLPDTDEYLDNIIKGLNWLISVFNVTKELINENEMVIDKDTVNVSVNLLNEGFKEKDDAKLVEALKGMQQFVETFKAEAERVTAD
jgi:hypothetical protein